MAGAGDAGFASACAQIGRGPHLEVAGGAIDRTLFPGLVRAKGQAWVRRLIADVGTRLGFKTRRPLVAAVIAIPIGTADAVFLRPKNRVAHSVREGAGDPLATRGQGIE